MEIYDEVPSTQDAARECLSHPPFLVVASCQSKGKGRLGRVWESPRGGLYFTLVIEALSQLWAIPLVSAYTVWKALSSKVVNLRLKWPNDVYADGGKLAGIIVETWGGRLGIGVGVNVNQRAFRGELVAKATSLSMIVGQEFNLEGLLEDIVSGIIKSMEKFREFGFAHFHPEVQRVLLSSKQPVKFSNEGKNYTGKLLDMDSSGSALVQTSDGRLFKLPAQHLLESP